MTDAKQLHARQVSALAAAAKESAESSQQQLHSVKMLHAHEVSAAAAAATEAADSAQQQVRNAQSSCMLRKLLPKFIGCSLLGSADSLQEQTNTASQSNAQQLADLQ